MRLRCILVPLVAALVSVSQAQVETAQHPLWEQSFPFEIDAINFASESPGRGRLDVFVRIPYQRLAFVQSGTSFTAAYEIAVYLVDSAGKVLQERSWTEEIQAPTFDESISSQSYSLTQQVFEAKAGEYRVTVVIRDLEVRTPQRQSVDATIRDFSQASFAFSGIMLVSRITQEKGKKIIVPNVSPNVGSLNDGFHAFFEAYNRDSLSGIRLITEVLDERGETVFREETSRSLVPGRNRFFVRVDHAEMVMGEYLLRIRAARSAGAATGEVLAESQRRFLVRWFGVPLAARDLDVAIQQTQYIANAGEVEEMEEAGTIEEKRTKFLEFWKKRDPNPATPRNEKMEEYYAKVEYANKHFAHYIEGWRTDMGMVYIIFGAPNNVDRHPFDHDSKPYEVWSYYDLNHQFTFVDETGFGDYRLTTPIWEVWQRPDR